MPIFDCKCGERIDYGKIPSPNEWLFISDVEFDGFSGLIEAEELYAVMKSFLKCNKCARLWFFCRGYGESPEEYILAPL
jgi:hypothetical protein